MKNKGFTLVEVLVVLIVLSVIALLTLPAIISNVQKHQVGPALTKAMATLETAHALIMNEHEMSSLFEGCNMNMSWINTSYIEGCFEPYIMKTIGAVKDTTTATYDKFNNSGTLLTTMASYTTKSGVTYIFRYTDSNSFVTQDGGRLMQFYIDINGINKKPNIYGKDLFSAGVLVTSEGQVIAHGSKLFSQLFAGNDSRTWVSKCNSTTPINRITGEYCAGSVIDNGGKVIYPWK